MIIIFIYIYLYLFIFELLYNIVNIISKIIICITIIVYLFGNVSLYVIKLGNCFGFVYYVFDRVKEL